METDRADQNGLLNISPGVTARLSESFRISPRSQSIRQDKDNRMSERGFYSWLQHC